MKKTHSFSAVISLKSQRRKAECVSISFDDEEGVRVTAEKRIHSSAFNAALPAAEMLSVLRF